MRNLRTLPPTPLRQRLSDEGAGVVWCHTDDYTPLDAFLSNPALTEHPTVRRVTVTVSSRARATILATDVARAIGVTPGAGGRSRSEVRLDQLVPLLLEYGITDMLISSALWTDHDALADLTVVTRAAGVNIWLLGSGPCEPAWEAFLHGLGIEARVDQVLSAFADINDTPPPGTHSQVDPWTTVSSVPTSDFVTFLADVHDQLQPLDAALVEATLRSEHAHAQAWFAVHPTADVPAVGEQLHARWQTCVAWPQFLTIVRAWQIAAFHADKLLKVDPAQLAGTAGATPSTAQRSVEQWARLRAWHEPSQAAACALLAAGLGSENTVAVTIGAVAEDGSTVTEADGKVTVIEEAARSFARAALHARRLAGAAPDQPLLVTANGSKPSFRWAATQATNARTQFGLPLSSGAISQRTLTGDRWASRWGLLR